MENDRCYLISTKRPKETTREGDPKFHADYCNRVTNIYMPFSRGKMFYCKNDLYFNCYTLILLNKQIDEEEKDLRKCSFASHGKNRTIKIKVCTSETFDPCSFSDPFPGLEEMIKSKTQKGNYEDYHFE